MIKLHRKLIVPFVLFMAVGFILAAGCVVSKNNKTVNDTIATTTASFTPFPNTSDTGLNITANYTAKLNGSLRVSISGYPEEVAVVLDNEAVGTVKPDTPLNLMVTEGNHTVMVCVGLVCEQENVTISSVKKSYLDFGDRLRKDVEFPLPTARIVQSFKNGNGVSVNVEFINPTIKPLTISVDISCGYSYNDYITHAKLGDSATGRLVQSVEAGQRLTQRLDLYFASGTSYNYDIPTITDISIK